jgi:type II secretory pathway pseudopilin PulG
LEVEVNEEIKHVEQQPHSNEAGFTLMETAIAMVLLAIAGLGVASVFFFAAKNNISARDRELAMAVAQQTMEQLRNVQFSDASLVATGNGGTSSTIIRAGRTYSVQKIVANTNSINGRITDKTITITVTPWSDGTAWSRNVSSVFGSVTMISHRTVLTVGPYRGL